MVPSPSPPHGATSRSCLMPHDHTERTPGSTPQSARRTTSGTTTGDPRPPIPSRTAGFTGDTAVQALSDGTYSTEIKPGWDIAGNANGGYLLSIAVRAMIDASPRSGGRHRSTTCARAGPQPPASTPRSSNRAAGSRRRPACGRPTAIDCCKCLARSATCPHRWDPSASTLRRRISHLLTSASQSNPARRSPHRSWAAWTCVSTPTTPVRQRSAQRRARVRRWFRLRNDEPIDTLGLILATDAFAPTAFGWPPQTRSAVLSPGRTGAVSDSRVLQRAEAPTGAQRRPGRDSRRYGREASCE